MVESPRFNKFVDELWLFYHLFTNINPLTLNFEAKLKGEVRALNQKTKNQKNLYYGYLCKKKKIQQTSTSSTPSSLPCFERMKL